MDFADSEREAGFRAWRAWLAENLPEQRRMRFGAKPGLTTYDNNTFMKVWIAP